MASDGTQSSEKQSCFRRLSKCAQGAIVCGVCSAVVLAVMIPLTICVIGPNMGQHALNVAVMNIPNSTVFDIPGNIHKNRTAHIFNKVKLEQSALPFYAKLHETDLVMNVAESPPSIEALDTYWPQTNLAWFTMPEQGVSHGENDFQFRSDFNILDPDTMVIWTIGISLDHGKQFFANGSTVYIVGEPKLTALGLITMKLKFGKELTCYWVDPPTTTTTSPPPTTTTSPPNASAEMDSIMEGRLLEAGVGPVYLRCEDQGEMDDDLIDEILQNFTRDRIHNTPPPPTTTAPPTTTTKEALALV